MFRARLLLIALLLLGLAAVPVMATRPADPVPLFNGKDLTGWKLFLAPNSKTAPEETFKVEDGVIHVSGKPAGYFITEKEYSDYVLRVEWRWAGKPGNSGVLLHVSGPDKIWPKSAEAQLMANHAGDFWLIDNFPLTVDQARQDKKTPRHYFRSVKDGVEKPAGEWNQYVITCKGDTIKLEINGQVINEGTGAGLTKGKIALQSEGAQIQFRNITIAPLN